METLKSTESACKVLVVGAGPVGLTLASELLAQGVSTRIIERRDGAALHSQALAVHPHSLELFDARGIAERLVARGGPIRRMHMYVDGKRLVTMGFQHNGSWFGYGLSIPQRETELVLRERIAELDGRVDGQTELLDFEQDEEGVSARIMSRSGEIETVRCEYVVGCDGAHSTVRHQLGLKFDGQPYPQQWLMVDARLDWALSSDEAHSFFRSDGGSLALFPLPGGIWRVVLPFAGERGADEP
ncbi:MAG TPA: FAD-dependent monooxygenase, partial [Candidatus Dormibacteraeota bacterium]|nr:FAD-dependent monooxygenase [Candidatus Dormibacteraeota bacterium]